MYERIVPDQPQLVQASLIAGDPETRVDTLISGFFKQQEQEKSDRELHQMIVEVTGVDHSVIQDDETVPEVFEEYVQKDISSREKADVDLAENPWLDDMAKTFMRELERSKVSVIEGAGSPFVTEELARLMSLCYLNNGEKVVWHNAKLTSSRIFTRPEEMRSIFHLDEHHAVQQDKADLSDASFIVVTGREPNEVICTIAKYFAKLHPAAQVIALCKPVRRKKQLSKWGNAGIHSRLLIKGVKSQKRKQSEELDQLINGEITEISEESLYPKFSSVRYLRCGEDNSALGIIKEADQSGQAIEDKLVDEAAQTLLNNRRQYLAIRAKIKSCSNLSRNMEVSASMQTNVQENLLDGHIYKIRGFVRDWAATHTAEEFASHYLHLGGKVLWYDHARNSHRVMQTIQDLPPHTTKWIPLIPDSLEEFSFIVVVQNDNKNLDKWEQQEKFNDIFLRSTQAPTVVVDNNPINTSPLGFAGIASVECTRAMHKRVVIFLRTMPGTDELYALTSEEREVVLRSRKTVLSLFNKQQQGIFKLFEQQKFLHNFVSQMKTVSTQASFSERVINPKSTNRAHVITGKWDLRTAKSFAAPIVETFIQSGSTVLVVWGNQQWRLCDTMQAYWNDAMKPDSENIYFVSPELYEQATAVIFVELSLRSVYKNASIISSNSSSSMDGQVIIRMTYENLGKRIAMPLTTTSVAVTSYISPEKYFIKKTTLFDAEHMQDQEESECITNQIVTETTSELSENTSGTWINKRTLITTEHQDFANMLAEAKHGSNHILISKYKFERIAAARAIAHKFLSEGKTVLWRDVSHNSARIFKKVEDIEAENFYNHRELMGMSIQDFQKVSLVINQEDTRKSIKDGHTFILPENVDQIISLHDAGVYHRNVRDIKASTSVTQVTSSTPKDVIKTGKHNLATMSMKHADFPKPEIVTTTVFTNNQAKFVGVMSPRICRGRTTTTLNLAASLVADGKTVLIVDCTSTAQRSIAYRLNLKTKENLTCSRADNVIDATIMNSIVMKEPHTGADLTSAKTIGIMMRGEYVYENIDEFIEIISKHYDYIIINVTPNYLRGRVAQAMEQKISSAIGVLDGGYELSESHRVSAQISAMNRMFAEALPKNATHKILVCGAHEESEGIKQILAQDEENLTFDGVTADAVLPYIHMSDQNENVLIGNDEGKVLFNPTSDTWNAGMAQIKKLIQ